MDDRSPYDPLTQRSTRRLARVLSALDRHTEAPLRLRGHSNTPGAEVFELQEEFELGPRGRRFLLSVDKVHPDAMVVALSATSEGA